jgi:hypothetical protein
MGHVSFSVDPDQLDLLSGQLQTIESGMQNSGNMVAVCDPHELGPNVDVWNALQHFQDDWSNGLFMITDNIARLLKLLAQAAESYRGTDEQIAQAATPQTRPTG